MSLSRSASSVHPHAFEPPPCIRWKAGSGCGRLGSSSAFSSTVVTSASILGFAQLIELREPEDPFPEAHIHVNATPEKYPADRKGFHKLHLPAGRVAFEDVVRFLILEQGVPPSSPGWEDVIAQSKEIFDRIQGRPSGRMPA